MCHYTGPFSQNAGVKKGVSKHVCLLREKLYPFIKLHSMEKEKSKPSWKMETREKNLKPTNPEMITVRSCTEQHYKRFNLCREVQVDLYFSHHWWEGEFPVSSFAADSAPACCGHPMLTDIHLCHGLL